MFPQSDIKDERYVIFSSDLDDIATSRILSNANVPFKRVEGKYKNVEETSYILNVKDLMFADFDLYFLNNQESMLLLGPESKNGRPVKIIYRNNRHITVDIEELNLDPKEFFTSTDETTAKKQSGYTYDPSTNTYYIIVPK